MGMRMGMLNRLGRYAVRILSVFLNINKSKPPYAFRTSDSASDGVFLMLNAFRPLLAGTFVAETSLGQPSRMRPASFCSLQISHHFPSIHLISRHFCSRPPPPLPIVRRRPCHHPPPPPPGP